MSNPSAPWQEPPDEFTLPHDRIDIWRVELDAQAHAEQELKSLLAGDELDRAARFHFDRDRLRYIRGRTALRILIGRYLRLPPGDIRFQYENNGKPEIASPDDFRGLRFNVSHSGGLALMAFGCAKTIGIDVEKTHPMPDLVDIAKRFFSAREVQAILALRESKREEAFFACWTRKEAFLKATGCGLSYPLSGFSVSVDPDQAAELLEIEGSADRARQWFLIDVMPADGFYAALACKGERSQTAYWNFVPSRVGPRPIGVGGID